MKRITWLDYYKAVLIIMVVVLHTHIYKGLNLWLYSIPMQAFFFASGCLLKSVEFTSRSIFGSEVHKEFKRLMVPYYLWAAIFAALSLPNFARILYASYPMLKAAHPAASPLWFLPVLFVSLVLLYLCRIIFQSRFSTPVKLCAAVCAFVVGCFLPKLEIGYPVGCNVAIVAFGFLLLGNVCFPCLQRFSLFLAEKRNKQKLCVLSAGLVIFGGGGVHPIPFEYAIC